MGRWSSDLYAIFETIQNAIRSENMVRRIWKIYELRKILGTFQQSEICTPIPPKCKLIMAIFTVNFISMAKPT